MKRASLNAKASDRATFFSPKQKKQNTQRMCSRDNSTDGSRGKCDRSINSRFQSCPMCNKSLPLHLIEAHASKCFGEGPPPDEQRQREVERQGKPSHVEKEPTKLAAVSPDEVKQQWSTIIKSKCTPSRLYENDPYSSNPFPGLFIFDDFISQQEEEILITVLDDSTTNDVFLPWMQSKFNGKHMGKRWGVHCSLKDRAVYPEENPLPQAISSIIDRISSLHIFQGCKPNEANAIDYHRVKGDYLRSHVDDRQLSKEPIANLSLAGDCYMTFRLQKQKPTHLPQEEKILLKRRTLQVLIGSARYDYSHGIQNDDLLSERRISITTRESPVTRKL